MAQAPEPSDKNIPSLPDRAAKYRDEIDRVVREVGEHPLYELKRSCSFTVLKETLPVLLRSRDVLPYRAARNHLGTVGE